MSVDPSIYQALVIASALRLYVRTGMKANRAYTPRNMMEAAARITGKKFRPRAYLLAADALQAHAEALQRALPAA